MITPEYLEYAVNRVSLLYDDLQTKVIEDVTNRLLATDFDVADTAVWRVEKLQQSGLVYDDIMQRLSETTGKSKAELKRIFEDAGTEVFNYGDEVYQKLGMKPLSVKQAPAMLKVLKAGLKTTSGRMYNLVNTTAFVTENEFIEACDMAHTMIASGAYSYTEAIVSAVERAGKAGAYVFYPTGHRDRVDVAARRAVLSGLGKTIGTLNMMACDEMDCDLVEVTAHWNARPYHADWQGLVYSRSGKNKNYPDFAICGYGTGAGLLGWNCYHDFHPFFDGISKRLYSDQELDKMKNNTVTYNGREMSGFDATQLQRSMERKIRESKRKLIAFNKGKKHAENSELAAAFAQKHDNEALKLRKLNDKLNDFVEQTGFQKQYDRSRVIGFGRPEAQRAVSVTRKSVKPVDNSAKSGIMNVGANSAIRNTGKRLKYNDNADFKMMLDGYSPIVNEGLSKACKDVAKLGGKDGNEHLILVNLLTGEAEFSEIGDETSVGYEFWGYVDKNKDKNYAFVHNHNTDGCFSENDISTLLTTKNIKVFVAARIDGVLYATEKIKDIENGWLESLYVNEINEINQKMEEGFITSLERNRLREEILVENSLRDYTKGLMEFGGK